MDSNYSFKNYHLKKFNYFAPEKLFSSNLNFEIELFLMIKIL